MLHCIFTWAQYTQKHTSYSKRSQHSNYLRLGCTCICCRQRRFCRGSADMGVSPAIQLFGQPYGLQEMIRSWGGGRHRRHSDDVGVRFDRLHHGGIGLPHNKSGNRSLAMGVTKERTLAQASGGPRVTALEPSLDEPGGKALESILRTGLFYS